MVDQLRTELHSEVNEEIEKSKKKGTHIRSNHLSVEGARQLKVDTMQEIGWLDDPEPVGNVRNYLLERDNGQVPIRIYNPDEDDSVPILLWLHGGGWTRGSLDYSDPVCRGLVNQTPCTVVSVGYRLAPEYPFPIGLEDCYTALEWTAENGNIVLGDEDKIGVGGPSAGGNLTVALALLARERNGPSIASQIPCVPALDRPRGTESYQMNAEGYGLSRDDMYWYWDNYIQTNVDEFNPYAAPLQARELSELPPATVVTAGFDPLRDDGIEYVDRLQDAGVSVDHHHYPDMTHSVTSSVYYRKDIGRTREAIENISDSIAIV